MYAADAPVPPGAMSGVDLDAGPDALYAAVERLGLRFIVVSFHDDIAWTIALNSRD